MKTNENFLIYVSIKSSGTKYSINLGQISDKKSEIPLQEKEWPLDYKIHYDNNDGARKS